MNRSLLAIAAAATALTVSVPASAAIVTYFTTLGGALEAPPNASLGTGFGTVTLDDVLKSMRVQVSFSGLTGTVTAAHIHCCTATPGASTAGVATVTPTFTGFPSGVTAGVYDRTYDMTALAGSWNNAFLNSAVNGGNTSTAFSTLMAGLDNGSAYLNVHTTSFPGGEIRGFLHVAQVPEPGSSLLVLAALGMLAATTRRRLR